MNTNEYHQQANSFLHRFGLRCRITLSNTKLPAWDDGDKGERNHYRVTLSRHFTPATVKRSRVVFDFWGSINDAAKGEHPNAYDVLACIGSDIHTPDTFKDYCDEFGYNADSIKALQTFRRTSTFAKRLQAFFTADELTALADIQ